MLLDGHDASYMLRDHKEAGGYYSPQLLECERLRPPKPKDSMDASLCSTFVTALEGMVPSDSFINGVSTSLSTDAATCGSLIQALQPVEACD